MASIDFIYDDILKLVSAQEGMTEQYQVIDNIARSIGAGAEHSRYSEVFYGLNRLPNLPGLPSHREMQGLVLFTRPHLNLSYDNISSVRTLSHLLTQDPNSYQYAVRMLLDHMTQQRSPVKTPLVDQYFPYLTLLSNNCITMSPPPDIGINLYSSPEGMMKEVWIMNDSISEHNGRFDLTCTFNNMKGNAMILLFHTWLIYIGQIRVGPMRPHQIQVEMDEMDYFTRIERLKLDISGRYVEQWFHTGAAVPTNISIGSGFSYNRLEPMELENKEISVQFACVGAVYNDPIQLFEFNIRVQRWNPRMNPQVRNSYYVKIPHSYVAATNYYGYPWINLATQELEWWIDKETLSKLTKGL